MSDQLFELRPHQVEALDQLKHAVWRGSRSPLLQLPTGAGKTVIAAHIVSGSLRKGNRVAFSVPTIGLIGQTAERFCQNGIDVADIGVIQADHPWKRPDAPIQICSAQTLARRELPKVDIVVIDEAHVRHKVYDRWILEHGDGVKAFIGLTATPWASDLGKLFDTLLKPTSTQELIDGGYLSPFRVFAPSHPDLTAVRTVAGDYHEGDLETAMTKTHLIADVVTQWLARANGLPTLVFCVSRNHAQAVALQFIEAGVSCAYVDANTPREERDEIGRQLHSGEVKVVCNIGCLTTGIDWDVRCLVLARPTKSEMLFVQIIGRALRTAEGKDHALILDHSDTHLRLGMVTDIDHDELDDGTKAAAAKRKDKERSLPLPKECPSCAALVPALMQECPCCGAAMPRRVNVEVHDGDLQELGGRGAQEDQSIRNKIRALGKADVYAMLAGYAEERNRKKGWIAHTYKDIFGVWPKGVDHGEVDDPVPFLRYWLKSRDRAFAMRKNKGGSHHVV